MHYRPDIDGLRAIAVLAVTLQHYQVPGFGGGFAGVDVFFVISGYLIAAGIGNDLAAGRFSLLSFYERRIRRIIPALFVMYALVLVASTAIFFPPESNTQSRMAIFVVPFLANFAFFENAGAYGGEFANQIALLHTWSLAVEEQFYLLFPLLMIATARFGAKRQVIVLWCLALCSLVSCVIAVRVVPRAAFYLPPFRAWELLAGALLALRKSSPPREPAARNALALVGFALIVGASVFLSLDRPYPSELTLLPCMGAVAIIYASCPAYTPMGRLLGNPFMRCVGLWSYSIYLYHWPLLVLAQYYAFEPLTPLTRALLLAVSILLAGLSWRYVEQPFRGPNAWLPRRAAFGLAAVTGAALMAGAAGVYLTTRVSQYTHQQARSFPSDTATQLRCRNTSPEESARPPCKLGEATAAVTAVLWGDSHALAVLPAIDAVYAEHHEAVMLAQHGGCPPLLGVRIRAFQPAQSALLHSWLEAAGYGRSEVCKRHTDAVLDWIIHHHIRTVILAGHWIAYTQTAHRQWLSDSESPDEASARSNAAVFARGLERLLAVLQRERVRVFVFEDVPQSPVYVPYALAASRRRGLDMDFRITRAQYDAQQSSAAEIFERLRKKYEFQILQPQELLCASGRCAVANNDDSLYEDDEHLSALGAMVTEPVFERIWGAVPTG